MNMINKTLLTAITLTLLLPPLAFAKTYTKAELMKMGEVQYGSRCLLCHKDNGKGIPPVFPSLVGSKITTGSIKNHIKLVLNGVAGTAMVAFNDQLNDTQIACIITYQRNSWGNDNQKKYGKQAGGVVQPEDVAKGRS